MRREVTGALVSLLSSWQPDGNTNTTKVHVSAPVTLMTRGPSSPLPHGSVRFSAAIRVARPL